ncbi:MAG: hypothetical protein LCH90_19035 [Proteobacteria bacterium]|nr:hypothetical protein [Pseudomonadota bacterium]
MLEHTLPYLAASELLRALDEKLVDKTQLGIEELVCLPVGGAEGHHGRQPPQHRHHPDQQGQQAPSQ